MFQRYNVILFALQNKRVQFWLFLVVLVIMTLYMMNLFHPLRGLARYDFYFHYNRLYTIIQSLENGTFPFYMDNNVLNGYGYFTKAFYPDLVLFPFAVIGYFTGLYAAYQSLIFALVFFAGIFTYIAVNKIYKDTFAAAIGSIIYTFSIYRLSILYSRGALGESIAFTLLPLVAWGIYEILKGDYRKWYILAIACFLLMNAHVISTVLVSIIVLIFMVIYYKSFVREPIRLKYLTFAGIMALIASSYFLLPFIEQLLSNSYYYESTMQQGKFRGGEMKFQTVVFDTFSYLRYDIQVGIGGLLAAMVCLRLFIRGMKTPQLKSIDYGVIIAMGCIFICGSYFPWNMFPFTLLHFIQFPWRFLLIAVYLTAVAGGFYVSLLLANQPLRKAALFLFIVFITCYGMRFGQGEQFSDETPVITETTMDFPKTVIGAEYLPCKVPSVKYIETRGDKIACLNSETTASRFARQKDGLSFRLNTNQKETLELPLLYYKGYRAELDGQELGLRESPNGLVEITAGKSGEVNVYYAGTVIQKISIWLTLLSLLALVGYMLNRKYCNRSRPMTG